MRCSHFLQPSTTCCGSPPGRRSSTAGPGRASPAGCSPPCRRGTGGYALGEWATSNASPGRSSSRRAATTSRPAPTSPSPLLFDPLVDACLLINIRQNGGKPLQKMRVLVLTDYYPLKLLLGQMSVLIGQKWLALRARHLVKHDAARPGIEALAKALIERRELSGTEACKVIVEAKRRRASL